MIEAAAVKKKSIIIIGRSGDETRLHLIQLVAVSDSN
jgi:hypothetical protein